MKRYKSGSCKQSACCELCTWHNSNLKTLFASKVMIDKDQFFHGMIWIHQTKQQSKNKLHPPPVSWEHRGVSPEKVTKGPHKQRIIFQASFYSKGHVKFQMRSCIFTTEKINYILVGGFNPRLKKYARQKWLFESFSTEYRWGPKRRWWGQKVCFNQTNHPRRHPIPAHPISTLANVLPRMACSAPSPPDAAKTGPVWMG